MFKRSKRAKLRVKYVEAESCTVSTSYGGRMMLDVIAGNDGIRIYFAPDMETSLTDTLAERKINRPLHWNRALKAQMARDAANGQDASSNA
jgi:hypothetical protein